MQSGSKRMVLNIKQHIPSVGIYVPGQRCSLKIGGTINYTALTMDPHKHGASILSIYVIVLRLSIESFIQSSQFQYIKWQNPNRLFVIEVKQEGVPPAQHAPQAVAKMYASAKYLTYESVFCLCLSLMLSHIHLGKGFSMVLSQIGMSGFF